MDTHFNYSIHKQTNLQSNVVKSKFTPLPNIDSTDRYFLHSKTPFTTAQGDVQNTTPNSSRAARRQADKQAVVCHSVKCSDGNPY